MLIKTSIAEREAILQIVRGPNITNTKEGFSGLYKIEKAPI